VAKFEDCKLSDECWTITEHVGRTDGHKMGMFDELMDKNTMIGRTDGSCKMDTLRELSLH